MTRPARQLGHVPVVGIRWEGVHHLDHRRRDRDGAPVDLPQWRGVARWPEIPPIAMALVDLVKCILVVNRVDAEATHHVDQPRKIC